MNTHPELRTIKLTDEQIAHIHQALGIAEAHFTKIYTDIVNDVVNTSLVVRKFSESEEQIKNAKISYEMAYNMADLKLDFQIIANN